MKKGNDNPIIKLSFEFALDIISYCEKLEELRKYAIANQLLRSGTSVGANIREAQNAESKADFIHKMKVAAKEADETFYWLELCEAAVNYPPFGEMKDKIQNILKILNKIISTSKLRST
ncbi:MAG: four helix bundle protein [Bacteroidia bacterium]